MRNRLKAWASPHANMTCDFNISNLPANGLQGALPALRRSLPPRTRILKPQRPPSWLTSWLSFAIQLLEWWKPVVLLTLVQLHPMQLLYPTPSHFFRCHSDLFNCNFYFNACMDSSNLAIVLFGPLPSEALTIHLPQPDEERALQEWCSSELVSLPSTSLPASDGTIPPFNQREQEELSNHIRSGHFWIELVPRMHSNLRRKKIHSTIGRLTLFTLTSPVPLPDDGFTYFSFTSSKFSFTHWCQGAYFSRFCRICDALERMVAFFESLQSESFAITDSLRVKRLHSDRAGEFTAPCMLWAISHQSQLHLPHLDLWAWPSVQSNCWTCSWPRQTLRLEPLLLLNLIVPTGLTLSEMLLSLYCVMHFNDISGLYLLVFRWLLRSSITRRSSFLIHARLLVVCSFGVTCKTKSPTTFVLQEDTALPFWLTALAFLQDCLLQLTLMSSLVLILYLLCRLDPQPLIDHFMTRLGCWGWDV